METKVTRPKQPKWGFSSAGRAPALHAGGQEFESPILHHLNQEPKRLFFSINDIRSMLLCIREFDRKYHEFDMLVGRF